VKNVEMSMEKNILVIRVDLDKEFGLSSTKKSIIIGSTEGNVPAPKDSEIKIGLNVFKQAK
jgi:hypothetical protein